MFEQGFEYVKLYVNISYDFFISSLPPQVNNLHCVCPMLEASLRWFQGRQWKPGVCTRMVQHDVTSQGDLDAGHFCSRCPALLTAVLGAQLGGGAGLPTHCSPALALSRLRDSVRACRWLLQVPWEGGVGWSLLGMNHQVGMQPLSRRCLNKWAVAPQGFSAISFVTLQKWLCPSETPVLGLNVLPFSAIQYILYRRRATLVCVILDSMFHWFMTWFTLNVGCLKRED